MSTERPLAIVIGGINGSGKTSSALRLLANTFSHVPFTNADTLAKGLHAFKPETVAISAGQVMLKWLDELARERSNLAFESTLAGRGYTRFLRQLRNNGYYIRILFFFLNDANLAVERVRQRVLRGGHSIPEVTIRQRYHRSLSNFWALYRPLANHWVVYDNSGPDPKPIGEGSDSLAIKPLDQVKWQLFLSEIGNGS